MTEWPLVPPWLQLTTSMGGLRPTRDDASEKHQEESAGELIDGSFRTMMARTARFHRKHDFDDPISNGHDMGYRLALTMEELGEFASCHHQRETRNGRRGGTTWMFSSCCWVMPMLCASTSSGRSTTRWIVSCDAKSGVAVSASSHRVRFR